MTHKLSFWAQFQPFLNNSIKTLVYFIHHLACHHWSKFKQIDSILGSFGPPKEEGGDLTPAVSPLALSLKSYFARDVLLGIRLYIILQSIHNLFGLDTPRILLGNLSSDQKSIQQK